MLIKDVTEGIINAIYAINPFEKLEDLTNPVSGLPTLGDDAFWRLWVACYISPETP